MLPVHRVRSQDPSHHPRATAPSQSSTQAEFGATQAELPVDSFRISGGTATPFEPCKILGAENLDPAKARAVKLIVERAVHHFQENYGSVTRPVVLNVGGTEAALRTGFNLESDMINFPTRTSDGKSGLDSADIITHEVFHALTLQAYPELCTKDMTSAPEYVRFHEGLADYFTHQLYPDEHFAQGYPVDKPYLRSYRNKRRISLSSGGHSQGNAITAYLLKHQIQAPQVRAFLERGELTLESLGQCSKALGEDLKLDASLALEDKVHNYPPSKIRKYWLDHSRPLQVSFHVNESLQKAHPGIQVEWLRPTGMPSTTFRFERVADSTFQVSPIAEEKAEKVLAVFKDGDDVLGARPFYFGNQGRRKSAQADWAQLSNKDLTLGVGGDPYQGKASPR